MRPANFDDLAAEVGAEGGVLTVGMWKLRNLKGAGKLGKRVVEEIAVELKKRGLRHQPEALPLNQSDSVRIYTGGGQVGKVIDAAHEVSPEADEVLRSYAEAACGKLRERIEDVIRMADALGPNDPNFDLKKFSDELSGTAD